MQSTNKLKMRQEDYLESIYLLSRENSAVRITDIAKRLGVKKSTSVSMIEKLVDEGYLDHEKYGDVQLTSKGIDRAQEVYRRHLTILSFFKEVLDLPEDVAETDACLVEHHISNQTVQRLLQFMEFYQYQLHHDHSIITQLRTYFDNGTYPCVDNECSHIKRIEELTKGSKGKVLSVRGDERLVNNLFSNGFLPGAEFIIESISNGSYDVRLSGLNSVISIQTDTKLKIDIELLL
jgi:DtxR family Mn-dependent transcriptional regulator